MIISRQKKPPSPDLCLGGKPLVFVGSFCLLGVTITSDLTWRMHINETISKSKRLLGFLYRVFREGGQKCLSRLYRSVVLPHLDYCSSVWDPPHKTHIKCLEGVQSFAARIVTSRWASDVVRLKSTLKWPSLEDRRRFQRICLCRRILDGSSIIEPSFFQVHPRPSSSHKNSIPLFRPYVRMNHHLSSFKHAVVGDWNKVPDKIASLSSSSAFKNSLRKSFYA